MDSKINNKNVKLKLSKISKSFGSVIANKDVSLDVYEGEILSLLGENGSGKTTLMNMVSGIYYPDEGQIFVDGKEVSITSPRDAFDCRIGMVHQHFKLVDVFSSIENIVLGIEDKEKSNIKKASVIVKEICDKYGFVIDLKKKVYDMSVSEKQTLEIVKVLYRGADILILDEPTAVLTPSEIDRLFAILRKMKEDGKSIVIITHKLNEVLEISDRVAVLRKGELAGYILTKDADEEILTEMMVGQKVELNIVRSEVKNPQKRLVVENLVAYNKEGVKSLDNVSFEVNSGEILGIAGISGSGQREVLEAIAGLVRLSEGKITYYNPKNGEVVNLRNKTPRQIRELGVRLSFVPEDRLGMGLVAHMDLIDNMMLRSYRKGKFGLVDRKAPEELANSTVNELEVVTPSIHSEVRNLSGGNVQKVLVGREISSHPKVLMAAYPVRGLDINSSYLIYNLLNEQKEKGTAVIFVGEDLDVLLALSDRILVLADGKVNGILDARKTDKKEVGRLMTNVREER